MNSNKKAYFQGAGGVNQPTPKKKKYKSDKAIVVQPRFVEPFYKNYDIYDVESDTQQGPGTGAYNTNKNKSIKEFINKSRKKIKNKYEPKDSWIKDRSKKRKVRAKFFSNIIKQAIDYPTDETIKLSPILEQLDTYNNSVGIGGHLDEYLPLHDFENKSPNKLNFSRDYDNEKIDKHFREYIILKIMEKALNAKESDLLGLFNGFEPEEDLDADKTFYRINPEYGVTDSGSLIYENMWI